MKSKITKESRALMIAALLGDGSISKGHGYRMCHGYAQKEYLQWKINKFHQHGLKTCGLKESICSVGYNVGSTYYYTRMYIIPFVKTLRRIMYKPKKVIANRKMLNRLTPLGLAIWYMDDGCLNLRKKDGEVKGFAVRIATCLSPEDVQIIIDYFKEEWDLHFYRFSEGKGTYSIACGSGSGRKFFNIIRPYVLEVPSMRYKIGYNLDQKHFVLE